MYDHDSTMARPARGISANTLFARTMTYVAGTAGLFALGAYIGRNLTHGAGSDAHVLAGVGTGAVRMRRFSGPEEFLVSLHDAEVLRRPKSLVYLQGLKWVAQAKERVR